MTILKFKKKSIEEIVVIVIGGVFSFFFLRAGWHSELAWPCPQSAFLVVPRFTQVFDLQKWFCNDGQLQGQGEMVEVSL